jgi:hypothetical protein
MGINANYMTWNPLYLIDSSYPPTVPVEQGNLVLNTNNSNVGIGATQSFFTGKWYYEILVVTEGKFLMGLLTLDTFNSQKVQPHNRTGSYWVDNDGTKYVEGANSTISGFDPSDGDIIQFAFDRDARKLWVGLNGTYVGSGNPSAGSNELFSASDFAISTGAFMPAIGLYNSATTKCVLNAGQDSSFIQNKTSGSANAKDGNGFGDFYYTPPTDFLACASPNIPTSSDIDPAGEDGETENPDKQAGAVLYTGNGGSPDLAVTGLGFQPDLVWGKARGASQLPILQDSARGQELLFSSDSKVAQTSNGPFMASYDADGFTYDGSGSNPNDGSVTYVAWCFRANGGTATATITESGNNPGAVVQANPKGGFSIITYTGTGGAGTIAHGLDSAPTFMIMKNRGVADPWAVYHIGTDASAPATKYLVLNTNAAAADDATYWNDTAPTSSVLTVGTNHSVNADGENYVAYVWAPVEGGSRFGRFQGNEDDDGTFIYTGFRPKIIFIKENDNADDWCVYDTARSTFNPVQKVVRWENAAAEFDNSARAIDILSNGFKIRTSNSTINQASTFVYGAWGDVPFKYNNTF